MLAGDRAEGPAVRDPASRTQAAQVREIAQMTGWLQAWDAPETMTEGPVEGRHMGSTGTSEEDVSAPEDASGAESDELFREPMTAHHGAAADMAKTQRADGSDHRAIELAGRS